MNQLPVSKNRIILIVIAIIAFYMIFTIYSDINQFTRAWIKINLIYIPLVLLANFGFVLIRSIRQKLFLDQLNMRISLVNNIFFHMAGLALAVTPGGAGEMIKSYFLNNKYNFPYSKTIPMVLIEKYSDLLSVVIIILAMLFFDELLVAQILVIIMSIMLFLTYVIIRKKYIFKKIIPMITKIGILKKINENVEVSHQSLSTLLQLRITALSLSVGILAWSIEAFAIYLCFRAFNIEYSFVVSTLLMYTATVIGAISFIPGGLGITETGMLALLVKFGLEKPIASAVILFTRFTSIWFFTMIGIIVIKFVITKRNMDTKN